MQIGNLDGSWRALSSDVLAHGFDAGITASQSRGSRLARGDVIDATQEYPSLEWFPETIHISTFNTLTMRRTGAYMACARQLHKQGIALLGLQEARPVESGTQTIICGAARYLVLSSTATAAGTHGCQLWVCLCSSWAAGAKKHRIHAVVCLHLRLFPAIPHRGD